ncbi:MAG: leucyl/phenylalanyl-tRNA--protein transferase [Proteobacteria bacterium]|nr:MAG: leucyl/phenylalanyl-tRNA--protein transferase [Pseudomonadota bacterium]
MVSKSFSLYLLNPTQPDEPFPPHENAWDEPNGLLAVGGDLSLQRLSNAYRQGIFPWFEANEPIYWWSPDPRAVLFPEKIRITRSLRKSIRNKGYQLAFDRNFRAVVRACAAPRSYTNSTWITKAMYTAYARLHDAGMAHSVEVYSPDGQELLGGLYGVANGGIFCGESMFSRAADTSKIALIALAYHLQQWGFDLIDCQILNPHLASMGAENISRAAFLNSLRAHPNTPPACDWKMDNSADLSCWKPRALGS